MDHGDHTYGGGEGTSDEKRKRAKKRADDAAKDRAEKRRKNSGRGLIGTGMAGKASDALKANEQSKAAYWERL